MTHDPAVLGQRSNQLSYQANWELVICEFVPLDGNYFIYSHSFIFHLRVYFYFIRSS